MLIDFRESGGEGEREKEKHGCERETSISWDQPCNLGMRPDRNGTGDTLQSTAPHGPGRDLQV